eukprot:COSAG01_NODE_72791_length_252_cov_0.640523_1_plen_56_part_10
MSISAGDISGGHCKIFPADMWVVHTRNWQSKDPVLFTSYESRLSIRLQIVHIIHTA